MNHTIHMFIEQSELFGTKSLMVCLFQIWCFKKEIVMAFSLMPKDGIYRMKVCDSFFFFAVFIGAVIPY